ncbi:MAG: nuclear transport factor 2 family protein [Parahaliea sp.]
MANPNDSGSRRRALGTLISAPLALLGLGVAARAAAATAPATDELAQKIDALAAGQAIADAHIQIKRVLNLYARGWDRRDEEALRSCFWPDSTHEHGGFKGKSSDFIGGGLKGTASVLAMTHIITNETIDLKGDRAVCECYFLAHHRRPRTDDGEGLEDMFIKGRYLDRFERRDGLWKIAHRHGLSDYSTINRPASSLLDKTPAEQLSGKKPDDPLYAMLASLGTEA